MEGMTIGLYHFARMMVTVGASTWAEMYQWQKVYYAPGIWCIWREQS